MPAPPNTGKKPLPESAGGGGGFRLAVIAFSALVFAAVFGWLACIQRMESGAVEFHWHWSAALWIAAGIACPVYFWRQVWPVEKISPAKARPRVIKGWAALLIPSLMWMSYPLRFVSGQQLLNVFTGLAIAAAVLAFGGWMVYRLIRGFTDDETPSTPVSAPGRPDSKSTPVKQTANTPLPKNLGRDA